VGFGTFQFKQNNNKKYYGTFSYLIWEFGEIAVKRKKNM